MGKVADDDLGFTPIDMTITGTQPLLSGITNITGQCPDHVGGSVQGALQTVIILVFI